MGNATGTFVTCALAVSRMHSIRQAKRCHTSWHQAVGEAFIRSTRLGSANMSSERFFVQIILSSQDSSYFALIQTKVSSGLLRFVRGGGVYLLTE